MKTKLLFLAFLTSLLSWGQIFESFESGLPTSYTSTLSNVTLGSGTWQIDDVVQGTTGVQTGSYSAQIKSAIGAQIITPTLTGGVGVISFYVTASTTSLTYQGSTKPNAMENISTEFCINKNNIFIFTHYKQYRTQNNEFYSKTNTKF